MIRTIALALCLAAPLSTSAQTLDKIVAKHLEARGGLDRLQAIRTVRNIAREPQGPTTDETLAPVVIVEEQRPNLTRTTRLSSGLKAADYEEAVRNMKGDSNPLAAEQALCQDFETRLALRTGLRPTLNVSVSAFDGTSNWEWSYLRAAVRKLPGKQVHHFSIVSPIVKNGSRLELTGKATSEGHACYRLRVTSRQGVVRNVFIDAQTYLEVAVDYKPQEGSPGWRDTYDSWKVVDGVTVPHTITSIENSRRYLRRIDKVEFNVPIDDQRFAMPTGVR